MVDEVVTEKKKVTRKRRSSKTRSKGLHKVTDRKAYDKEYEISKLKLLVIIVNRNQGDFFINELIDNFNVAAVFLGNAHGTATREIYEVLGGGETKKDLVFALVKESIVDDVFEMINRRFSISHASKGIACTLKINSIISVLLYRFLTDTKQNVKRKG